MLKPKKSDVAPEIDKSSQDSIEDPRITDPNDYQNLLISNELVDKPSQDWWSQNALYSAKEFERCKAQRDKDVKTLEGYCIKKIAEFTSEIKELTEKHEKEMQELQKEYEIRGVIIQDCKVSIARQIFSEFKKLNNYLNEYDIYFEGLEKLRKKYLGSKK